MADDCLVRLLDPEVQKKLFGDRTIPREILNQFVKDIESIKVAVDKDPSMGSYASRVNEYIQKKQAEAQMRKSALLADITKKDIRWKQYTQPGIINDPIEAMLAKLTKGSGKLGEGLKDTAATRGYNIAQNHLNFLTTSLLEKDLLKAFSSGKLDYEIRAGIDALANNKEAVGISDEGKAIAQIVYDHNRRMLQEAHNSDVPTRDLKGFTATQTHDIAKVRTTGFDAWREKVESFGINKELVYGIHAGDREAELKILENIYKGIVLGKVGANAALSQGDIDDALRMGVSYTNKLTEARVLRFNDFKGEHAYNLEFGRSNLAESIYYDVTKKARMLGLVQIFGSNPEKAVQKDLERLEGYFRSQGDFAKADMVKRGGSRVTDALAEVTGMNTIPGSNTLAKVGSYTRWVNNMSKLVFTGLKSGANLATTAVKLQSVTGDNLLSTTLGSIHEWVKTLPPGAKNQIMEDAGFFIRDYAEQLSAHDTPMGGFQSRSLKFMFKWTGTDMISNGAKVASTRYMMKAFARATEGSWNDLHPQMKAEIMGIGLGEHDFNIMKRAVEEMPDGRKLLTPEGISNLDLQDPGLKARAADLKMSAAKYRDELQYKYMGSLNQVASTSSTSAGPRETSLLKMGKQAGTYQGEILRLFSQFKTYWVQSYNIMGELANSAPDKAQLAKGVLQSGQKDYKAVAQWLVGMTVLGYAEKAIRDMYDGKRPQDPRHWKTWADSMAYGGAGGIYTDALFGGSMKQNFSENLLGPTFGQLAGPGIEILRTAIDDMDDAGHLRATVKKQAVKLVRNNIPLQQFFIEKQLLDYLQYNVIQESLTPGYGLRKYLREVQEKHKGERL